MNPPPEKAAPPSNSLPYIAPMCVCVCVCVCGRERDLKFWVMMNYIGDFILFYLDKKI